MSDKVTSKLSKVSRRTSLKILGGSLIASPTLAIGVRGARPSGVSKQQLQEFYKESAKRYGKQEAKISLDIVQEYLSLKNKKGWSKEETYEKITNQILGNNNLTNARRALKKTRELKSEREKQTTDSRTNTFGTESLSTQSTDISLNYTNKQKNSNYNDRVQVDVDATRDIIHAVANASVYGSGYAWGRLYGRFTPSSTRTYTLTSQYYRRGAITNATARISLYIREDGYGPMFHTVEQPGASVNSTTTRSTDFSLKAGHGYNIGIELYTEANAAGAAISRADFYNDQSDGRRQLQVIDYRID